MIGLDTNVLVRYLVQDDPVQAAAATKLIESRCTIDEPGWIDHIVLCEMAWVLDASYGYARELIAGAIRQILATSEFSVEAPDQARGALRAFEQGGADFADFLIGLRNRDQGCEGTYTFDRKAARFDTHRLIK